MVNPGPEAELLLCCARIRMDSKNAERITALLRQELNWDYLLTLAQYHGILPLLYWHLRATWPEAVPAVSLDDLRDHVHANAQYNLLLTGELLKLLRLFEAHNIPAMPFKGPVLTAMAYGNIMLRQFSDMDLLIPKQHLLQAKDLLISQGYQPKLQLDGAEETAYLRSHHDYAFVRDDRMVKVDLQWGVTQRSFSFPFDFECVWERHEWIPFAGTTVRHLLPEDLLLILCVHGSKHQWKQLKWICDIAELIRIHPRIKWERLLEQAGMLGGERMLFLGLLLAKELLGTTLPAHVLERMSTDPVVPSLAVQVSEGLFCETHRLSRFLNERHVFYFRMRERWRDKIALCLHYFPLYLRNIIVPDEKDRVLLPLPTSLFFLYYLLRPIRLVGTYGLRQWKLK